MKLCIMPLFFHDPTKFIMIMSFLFYSSVAYTLYYVEKLHVWAHYTIIINIISQNGAKLYQLGSTQTFTFIIKIYL